MGNARSAAIDKIFHAFDKNGDGTIDRLELIAWVKDEKFIENPLYSKKGIKECVDNLLSALDGNKAGNVSKLELKQHLSSLDTKQMKELAASAFSIPEEVRSKIISKVFKALDTDGNGKITKDEVFFWIQHERAFKSFGGKQLSTAAKEAIFANMDTDGDKHVSQKELESFFKGWTVRQLREIAEDQVFLDELQRAATDRRRVLQNDRAYTGEIKAEEKKAEKERRRKKSDADEDEQTSDKGSPEKTKKKWPSVKTDKPDKSEKKKTKKKKK